MIPETPKLQRTIGNSEERYTNLIKQEFVRHAKEINRLNKKIEEVDTSFEADLSGYYTKEEADQKMQELISGEQEIVAFQEYNSIYNFPNVGTEGVIYVSTSDNSIYRWDNDNIKYYCVGRDWTQIKKIDGGNA